MGDVTRLRGGGSTVGGAAAEAITGEPVTIAVLIARAFGVLGEPALLRRGTTPEVPTQPGAPWAHPDRAGRSSRHLHVVRDLP